MDQQAQALCDRAADSAALDARPSRRRSRRCNGRCHERTNRSVNLMKRCLILVDRFRRPLTDEERFNERWVGKPEHDVLAQYGTTTEVLPLSNGNHVDSYHRE